MKPIVMFLSFTVVVGCAGRQVISDTYLETPLAGLDENRAVTVKIILPSGGHGTGVIASRTGHVLTCSHVVGEGRDISVEFESDGQVRVLPAVVLDRDRDHDLALLKVDTRFDWRLRPAKDEEIGPKTDLYAVGFPGLDGKRTSRGYVRRLRETFMDPMFKTSYVDAIVAVELDARAGASGSPIFSSATGRFIGILRAETGSGAMDTKGKILWDETVQILTGLEQIEDFLERQRTTKP